MTSTVGSPTGCFIEDLSWPEVAEAFHADRPVIVPVGAASKEHGHHLPMKTGWLLAEGIAARLPVLIAPRLSRWDDRRAGRRAGRAVSDLPRRAP